MKNRSLSLTTFVGCICITGCAPYVRSYIHPYFKETGGLKVLQQSTSSPDSQGRPLHSEKIGLPVEYLLVRSSYRLHIQVPINVSPVVFLDARGPSKERLEIRGPNIIKATGSYELSFLVEEAKGYPLQVEILDGTGKVLGTESLPYELKSRGFIYGIDSL